MPIGSRGNSNWLNTSELREYAVLLQEPFPVLSFSGKKIKIIIKKSEAVILFSWK